MPASQQNGHDFDKEIKKIYNVKSVSYTSHHDIPEEFNDGIPASVKSSVGDTCDCGDALRMFNNSNLDKYQMIRGRFEQVGEQKHLREVHLVDLSKSNEILWGKVTYDEVVALTELIKTYRPGDKTIHKAIHSMKAELNKKSGMMKFRPKMDSQKQRRLQCSIPKWTEFIKSNPTRVIDHTTTGLFRGNQLTLIKESLPRTRKARS